METTIIEGGLSLDEPANIAIISARFNSFIVGHLEAGALDIARRAGGAAVSATIVRVPGAFEIPAVAKRLASSGKYDAVIALGAVIRGSTAHFEHVAGACTRGLAGIASDDGIPVIFGVLTVDTIEQAVERAGTKAGNKGAEAMQSALEMISVMRQL